MKNVSNMFLKFLLLFFVVVLITQCNPDDDELLDARDKFTGNWNCTETATQNPNPITFSINITKDELTENEVNIFNIYHLGMDEKARALVNVNNINIPSQIVCNMTIQGSGSYSQNKITILYYVNDGADIDTVNAVFNR